MVSKGVWWTENFHLILSLALHDATRGSRKGRGRGGEEEILESNLVSRKIGVSTDIRKEGVGMNRMRQTFDRIKFQSRALKHEFGRPPSALVVLAAGETHDLSFNGSIDWTRCRLPSPPCCLNETCAGSFPRRLYRSTANAQSVTASKTNVP